MSVLKTLERKKLDQLKIARKQALANLRRAKGSQKESLQSRVKELEGKITKLAGSTGDPKSREEGGSFEDYEVAARQFVKDKTTKREKSEYDARVKSGTSRLGK